MPELSYFEARPTSRGLVVVAGQVDLDTFPVLRLTLDGALADVVGTQPAQPVKQVQPAQLVVDLSAVDFIDATGIGVLVGAANRARQAGGELVLRAPSRLVRRVLQVVELDGAFPVAD